MDWGRIDKWCKEDFLALYNTDGNPEGGDKLMGTLCGKKEYDGKVS